MEISFKAVSNNYVMSVKKGFTVKPYWPPPIVVVWRKPNKPAVILRTDHPLNPHHLGWPSFTGLTAFTHIGTCKAF